MTKAARIDLAEVKARASIVAVVSRYIDLTRRGDEHVGLCPFHREKTPSFWVNDEKGVFYCFGCGAHGDVIDFKARVEGCTLPEAAERIEHDLGSGTWRKANGQAGPARIGTKAPIVATYDYRDAAGNLVFQKIRRADKGFSQRRPKLGGGWEWNLRGVTPILYRLPELIETVRAGKTILIAEGEKDVDRLFNEGFVATTNPGGAGKWRPEFNEYFAGARVVILPDNDKPGREHAQQVACNLHGVAASVRVVELPDLPSKGDVSDWFDGGGTPDQLREICRATPEWTPPAAEAQAVPEHEAEAAPAGAPADSRPEVIIEGGRLPQAVDETEAALLAAKVPIYQRGGMLVRPVRVPGGVYNGIRRSVGSIVIKPVDQTWIAEVATRICKFAKWDARKDDYKCIDCPRSLAETLIARGEWRFPPLAGVIEAPLMRPDGTILNEPGFDDRTCLLFEPGAQRFGQIRDRPSRVDAERARDLLLDLLRGFPFVSAADPSVALAAVLTALQRRVLPSAPMIAFSAPEAGTGKSLLADVVAMIATGRRASVISLGKSPEEAEKRLGSALLQGDAIISLDNIERPLGGELLCQVLTQGAVKVRPLGVSCLIDAPTTVTIFCTGNNLALEGDITRRALLCLLDAKVEHPERRSFDINLHEEVPRRRGELVAAALTILRAYHVAGRPRQDIDPLGGFEAWSDLIRSALVWLGMPDPCKSLEKVRATDPRAQERHALITAWDAAIGEEPITVKDLVSKACQHEELRNALLAVAAGAKGGSIDNRRLGWWLRRNNGRVVGGLRLRLAPEPDRHSKTARWVVEHVQSGASNSAGFAGSGGVISITP